MFQKTFHGKFIIFSKLYFEYNRSHNMSRGWGVMILNSFFYVKFFWIKITLFVM